MASGRARVCAPAPSAPPAADSTLPHSLPPSRPRSLIRFFNYSKTPARGAGSVEVWLDGAIVFAGDLQPAGDAQGEGPRQCSSVAFSDDADLVGGDVERGAVKYCGEGAQDVVCWNDRRIVGRVSAKAALAMRAARGGEVKRPLTGVQ